MKPRIDTLVSQLCEEIDYYKEEAEYWKTKFEEERAENIQASNERLESAQKSVVDTLMLCFAIREDGNGGLTIPAENRKELVDYYSAK